jgi:hypothetical protein
MITLPFWDDHMSVKAPKLPPAPPPPPNAEDEASRVSREREMRRSKLGRRTLSLTGGMGGAPAGGTAMPSMAPGRNTVTGG